MKEFALVFVEFHEIPVSTILCYLDPSEQQPSLPAYQPLPPVGDHLQTC